MFNLTYKCRMCGATFVSAGCSNETVVVNALIGAATDHPDDSGTSLHEVHACKDASKNYGIADLIGAKFTPDK